MAMKRCPDCGEKYSDTYKYCPFCEEEEALREGDRVRRSGGGRRAAARGGRHSYSLVTPTLIILILIMSALLVYLLFGESISAKLRGEKTPDNPISSVEPPAPPAASSGASSGASSSAPDVSTPGTMPEDPSVTVPEVSYDTVNNLPSGLTLNKSDFTLPVGDPDVQLKVSGDDGTKDYTWVSQDPSVATVDSKGKVKAIANGTVNVLVSDGNRKGVCIVRVKGGSAPVSSGGSTTTTPSTTTPSSTSLALNKTDFTMAVGEMSVQLTVSGTSSGVTWTSSNTSVATVSDKGLVKAIGTGRCTVTASVDGQTLECIVRVKN